MSSRFNSKINFLPGMPARLAPFFEKIEYYRPGDAVDCVPTLFDILSQRGVPYSYMHQVPGSPLLSAPFSNAPVTINYVDHLDSVGHKYGAATGRLRKALHKVDDLVRQVVEYHRKRHPDLEVLVFSDHGMTETQRLLDVHAIVKSSDCELGRDYLAFYDSTMARFWFRSVLIKERMAEALAKTKSGRLLTTGDYDRYKLRFAERSKFGDLIFLAKPGMYIYPNYFHCSIPSYFSGMHGYDPDHPTENGVLLYSGSRSLRRDAIPSVIDLLPTMLSITGLPKPETCQGLSLIDE